MKFRPSLKKKLSLFLIVAGIVVILISAVQEASIYPWRTLNKASGESYSSLPDPTPIIYPAETPAVSVSAEQPAQSSFYHEPSPAAETTAAVVLPGEESVVASTASPDYYQMGIVKIPVLGISVFLLEGTGDQMHYGIGHEPGTAAPGQKGNCVIAGHRSRTFRYLDKLALGNKVIINDEKNIYTYTVYDSFTVLPTDAWVLGSVEGEDYSLTMITCTPYIVYSHRLIVRARLTDINGQSPDAFYNSDTPEATASQSPSASPPVTVSPGIPSTGTADAQAFPSVQDSSVIVQ